MRTSERFFYMLGSMGLSSSIGLGLSLTTDKQVLSIDGRWQCVDELGLTDHHWQLWTQKLHLAHS